MSRSEEDQILMDEGTLMQTGGKKRGPKRYPFTPKRDIRASIPLDRASYDARLEYGLSLMALGQDGVYE